MENSNEQVATLLLAWFDRERRDLPWRHSKDPYRIWLSEIMLQQTQVQTVIPYFQAFLQRWPTLLDLANADETAVLKAWEGLGYYSRARNLLAAARLMRDRHDGRMPLTEKDRLALPGIGEYTAAAIGAIAFGQPVAAVDGNIVRVFARLTATAWDPSDLKQRRQVRQLVESLLPPERAGDFNEALMDLGATICLPRLARCAECPLAAICQALADDAVARYPARPAAKARPVDELVVLVVIYDGLIRVNQRPAKGLLAGLYEFDWLDGKTDAAAIARQFPGTTIHPLGNLTHDFTHLRWLLNGFAVVLLPESIEKATGLWVTVAELAALPFPTALAGFRQKVLALL